MLHVNMSWTQLVVKRFHNPSPWWKKTFLTSFNIMTWNAWEKLEEIQIPETFRDTKHSSHYLLHPEILGCDQGRDSPVNRCLAQCSVGEVWGDQGQTQGHTHISHLMVVTPWVPGVPGSQCGGGVNVRWPGPDTRSHTAHLTSDAGDPLGPLCPRVTVCHIVPACRVPSPASQPIPSLNRTR